MAAPSKLKMMDIGENGQSTQVGTIEWDGKKWIIKSDRDTSCISALIGTGMYYGGKKLSFFDQDLYLPLTKSRTTMFKFVPIQNKKA